MVGVAEVGVPVAGAVAPAPRTRGRLFRKYVALFVAVVFLALLGSGLFEILFSYKDHEASLLRIQSEQAQSAAAKIDGFVKEIQNQLGWTTQLPWSAATLEQHRFDALRLLRQVPAITELSQLDSTGHERLRVSRLATDVVDSQQDFSHEPKFAEAVAHKVWYGPVYFRRESEPYMTLAVAGARRDAGVSVAEVNLKLIWDVVSQIKIGEHGQAFVVDAKGRLIAHPDISLVLRDTDLSQLPQVRAAREEAPGGAGNPLRAVRDLQGREVLSAHAAIAPLGWLVFVELPLDEAYAPLYASIARTAGLMFAGLTLAFLAGLFLARRMVVPIRRLQESAERLGEGDLSQRIEIKTGDEIETLADRFNLMAGRLQDSYATLEAKVEERTRDLNTSLQQQTATAEVLQAINASPGNLAPVFEAMLEKSVRLCDAAFGVLWIKDGELLRTVAMGSVPPPFAAFLAEPHEAAPDSALGHLLAGEPVVHIADLKHTELYRKGDLIRCALVDLGGAQTGLAVGLQKEGRALGAFTIYRPDVRPFSDKQVALLENFAAQAVIAIENTRLIAETREALDQQTATAEVLKVISRSAFDLDTVLETLTRSALELCNASQTALFLREGDRLFCRAFVGSDPASVEYLRQQTVPIDEKSYLGRSVLRGEIGHVADFLNDADTTVHVFQKHTGFRSLLTVPLLRQGEAIGALGIARPQVGAFSDRLIEVARTFADQAVIAIENTRLFDEVQARTHDLSESLRQQTATADVLKVISRSAFDLQTVLDTLMTSAATLCEAERGTIALRDGDLFRVRAALGDDPAFVEFVRANPRRSDDKSIVGRVARSGKVEHIPDRRLDPDYDFPGVDKFGILRALLGVPLLREGKVEGVFVLSRVETHPFTQRQIDLVQTFADQAVIAIENARLFEQVQARTRELARSLEDLRAAQDRLIQSEKMASLGQLTAGIAHEIKNPLNFVNNFASLSTELLGELKEVVESAVSGADAATREDLEDIVEMLTTNLAKIGEHGKRADGIVKSMLQHSRGGSGEVQETDLNALAEEALALAYHGLRAQDKSFNITMEKALDPAVGKITAVPQDLMRVLLNLIGNGFYAANKRQHEGSDPSFLPLLTVSSQNLGDNVEIRIRDNGDGISDEVRAKLFTPFFTTKPTGEGTGLGLSISYEIVTRGHGGSIAVESQVGAFTEFIVRLPRTRRQAPKNESKGQER